jgi:type IV secretory pathway VirB10-like protein
MTPADPLGGTPPSDADATQSFPVPQRPPLPRAERVRRGALTIVAVAMGTLVLAAVVFVQPGSRGAETIPLVPSPPAAEPTFLDQSAPRNTASSSGEPRAMASGGITGSDVGASAGANGITTNAGTPTSRRSPAASGDAAETWELPAAPAVPRPIDPALAAYQAAVAAPLRSRSDVEAQRSTGDTAESTPTGAVVSAGSAAGDRRWGRQQRFMQNLDIGGTPSVVRTTIEPAPGPYAIQAGTMIPAVLLTEIDSDLPGDVLAQVAHDVFDSRAQQVLLIPKGSRLIGTYDSDVSSNQRRLFVAWTRLIFPDGRSIALPGLETKDRSGAGGVADQVETHRRRKLGTAALLSLIGAGVQLAQPNGGYGAFGAVPSVGQVAAGAVGQQLAQVTTEMLRKQMDVQPTIRIRQGMPFHVFLRSDLAIAQPYEGDGSR